MTPTELRKFLNDSFDAARQLQTTHIADTKTKNRMRSEEWIKKLTNNLASYFEHDKEIKIFSKFNGRNPYFKRNEFLFDIVACRIAETDSLRQRRSKNRKDVEKIHYVKEVLWQIESEVQHNNRESLIDFSKLIMGSAKIKLFIGPKLYGDEKFRNILSEVAKACFNVFNGDIYVALIPHPAEWG